MYCQKCGTEIDELSKFCKNCGFDQTTISNEKLYELSLKERGHISNHYNNLSKIFGVSGIISPIIALLIPKIAVESTYFVSDSQTRQDMAIKGISHIEDNIYTSSDYYLIFWGLIFVSVLLIILSIICKYVNKRYKTVS